MKQLLEISENKLKVEFKKDSSCWIQTEDRIRENSIEKYMLVPRAKKKHTRI